MENFFVCIEMGLNTININPQTTAAIGRAPQRSGKKIVLVIRIRVTFVMPMKRNINMKIHSGLDM